MKSLIVTSQMKATEQYISVCTIDYVVQGDSNVWVWGWNPKVQPFKWKLLGSTFLWYCLLGCTRWFWLLCLRMKTGVAIIQMKAIVQYFPVVMFIML